MAHNPYAELRRWRRRVYLTQHQAQRRAELKAEGARRIDVTLRGDSLDDFDIVRRWIERINCLGAERLGDKFVPIPLTDQDVIRIALSHAASKLAEGEKGGAP